MNKNKIIFGIIGAVLLGFIALLVTNLASSGQSNNPQASRGGDFTIWTLGDSPEKFNEFLQVFKQNNPQYAGKSIIVESFDDYTTYQNTLVSAVVSGNAPDVFVLNNSETSILENQVFGIDPAAVSPNEFRVNFKPVFSEDLILSDENNSSVEFLKWVPGGYEVLGIFYNRKYFLRSSELETWGSIVGQIKKISEKHTKIIPLALGNGTGVSRAPEIIKTLFSLEGSKSLIDLNSNDAKQVLGMYSEFAQKNGDNRYNILSAPFVTDTDIDFFTQWDVAAIIGYPRDLLEIDKIWYQKSFLFASPFPYYSGEKNSVAINYNYFVINKDSEQKDVALDFMKFLSSIPWQQAYVEYFPYYISPESSVEQSQLEKKILPAYNVVYKNFIHDEADFVSYDLGNKAMFDTNMRPILDIESGYDKKFSDFRSFLICSTTKSTSLLNLSSSCK